jgi:thiol-disulfide isomerase/thioredoxin
MNTSEPTIESREQLKDYLENTNYETTIIKLTASWCGPCKKIAPHVYALNETFGKKYSYEYIEIDIDNALDLYAFLKKMKMANGVPTFLTYKKSMFHPDSYYVPFQCITGADPRGLTKFYESSLMC